MTPSSRRKLGLAFIIAPPACVLGTMIIWAIFGFIFSMSLASGGEGGGLVNGGNALVIGRIVNVALGFVGILGVMGFFSILPIGLYLFFSTPKTTVPPQVPPTPPQT